NFNQRDRNSRSDGYQTADQRKTHPNRSDEPDIFEHKKLLPAWKESLAHAVFSRTAGKGKLHCLNEFYRISTLYQFKPNQSADNLAGTRSLTDRIFRITRIKF